jgi:dTDP-glucose 4,6-dehydratase
VRDVADSVLAAVGADVEKVFVEERLGQVDRHIGSTDKLAALTGWRARTSFERGLEQTVAWYRENEGWWKALRARDSVSSS